MTELSGYQPKEVSQDQDTFTIQLNSGVSVEARRLNEAVTAVDVRALFPEEQMHLIEAAAQKIAISAEFNGGDVDTSDEAPDFTTAYDVITGEQIEGNLPYLWNTYNGAVREIVSNVAGQEVFADQDRAFGINVNIMTLATQKDGYEKHIDSNQWTGLLAVTDINEGDGGELLHFSADDKDKLLSKTLIRKGFLYVFEGHKYHHKVERLSDDAKTPWRITVPMDYDSNQWTTNRPSNMSIIHGKKSTPDSGGMPPSSNGIAARTGNVIEFVPSKPDTSPNAHKTA